MKLQAPEGMKEFLEPTDLCDSDNEQIKKKAQELIKDVKTPQEAAIRIFYFVRDQIPFGVDRADTKASETLKKGLGFCVTKTNLQIALLRAIGIPARYHQVVLDKDILKGILPDSIHKDMERKIGFHPWCECYLSGKWVSCDLFLDKALYDAACRKGIISKEKMPTIDWDGENDLKTTTAWIIEDVGTLVSFDEVSRKVREESKDSKDEAKKFYDFSNQCTDKLRKG